MREEIKTYFNSLDIPKEISMNVSDEVSLISSNFNAYLLGIYGFLIFMIAGIGFSSGNLNVLLSTLPFILLAYLNFSSKLKIRLTDNQIIVRDGIFKKNVLDVSSISFIDTKSYGGDTLGKTGIRVGKTSIRIHLNTGEIITFGKNAVALQFIFNCLQFYVDDYQKIMKTV